MGHRNKILLLYISEHSGHHCVSLAIEKAIRELDASADILNINGFNYTNPILERIVNRTYLGVVQRTPEIWDYLYDNPEVLKKVHKFREIIHHHNSGKLKQLLDEFRPDVIACTQAFPCGMIADFKKTFSIDTPLIGVVTDYVAHSYWIFDTVDYYIVPTDKVRDKIIKSGIDDEKIKTYGLPIDPSFARPCNKIKFAQEQGLSLETPTLLIMGGGQGLVPMKKIIGSLFGLGIPLQIVVVTGTNKRLFKSLAKLKAPPEVKVLTLGYVNYINELMEVADLLITKPGGVTITEAISKGLPMVIIDPLPGQEAKNAEFLLNSGLALMAKSVRELPEVVSSLLLNGGAQCACLSERCKSFAKANAARKTAELILRLSGNCPPAIQSEAQR